MYYTSSWKKWPVKMYAAVILIISAAVISPVFAKAAKYTISSKNVKMYKGGSKRLYVYKNSRKCGARWSSSNNSVARVNKSGLVKAVKNGKAVIKAKVNGKKTLKCSVKVVTRPVTPVNDDGNTDEAGRSDGNTGTNIPESAVLATVTPANAPTDMPSDTMPPVDEKPSETPASKVTGIHIYDSMALTHPDILPGMTIPLSISMEPFYDEAERIKWRSSSSKIASVNEDGVVTAHRKGTATITASLVSDESIKNTYEITVIELEIISETSTKDGGDLLLSLENSESVLTFSFSPSLFYVGDGVSVSVLNSEKEAVRTYKTDMGYESMPLTWDLKDDDGNKVPAGSYCYEISVLGVVKQTDYFKVYKDCEFDSGNGSEASPYEVADADEFNLVRNHNGLHFIQTADIEIVRDEFESMFMENNVFSGVYDGGGHSISGKFSITGGDYRGLFRIVGEEGVIRNLNLENCDIKSEGDFEAFGAVSGCNYGTISNCGVNKSSITAGDGAKNAAAVCGENGGLIDNCSGSDNLVTVRGKNSAGAVICGHNHGGIENCTSSGNHVDNISKYNYPGNSGIISGYNAGMIRSCISTDDVMVSSESLSVCSGGIAGTSHGLIISCNVKNGNFETTCIRNNLLGGIAGVNYGEIKNCGVTEGTISVVHECEPGEYLDWTGDDSDKRNKLGGIAGVNENLIDSCNVSACDINFKNECRYDTFNPMQYFGDIIGYNKGSSINNTSDGR